MQPREAVTQAGRRFELKRRIGAGAFGEVYLAEQVGAGGFRRPVALKLLNETAARMKEAAKRMRDEARILGRISHRNLVDVLDLIQLGDRWAIVMAYVPGADLEQVIAVPELAERGLPAPAVAEIGAAVARALHAAYTATNDDGRPLCVVHRDIKPSNVRLTPDGEVKVLDFGVARVQLDGREAHTRRQAMIGTERYMAPERILMESDGPEGDVYALGATLAELLLGEPIGRTPVRDAAHEVWVGEIEARLTHRLSGQPDAAAEAFIALICRSLHATPSERPASLAMVAPFVAASRELRGDDLVTFSTAWVHQVPEILGIGSGEPVSATLFEGSTEAAPTSGRAAPTVAPFGDVEAAPAPPPTKRTIRILLALALLLLALGGLTGLYALRLAGAPPPQPTADAGIDAGTVDPATASAAQAQEPAATEPGEPSTAPVDPAPPSAEIDVVSSEPEPPAKPSPAPAPAPRPKPAPTPTAAPVPQAEPDATPSPDGPRVSRAMIVVEDVSSFQVRCGDRSATGTASARLTNLPAGTCTVEAQRGAESWTAQVGITTPREVRCAVANGALTCR